MIPCREDERDLLGRDRLPQARVEHPGVAEKSGLLPVPACLEVHTQQQGITLLHFSAYRAHYSWDMMGRLGGFSD